MSLRLKIVTLLLCVYLAYSLADIAIQRYFLIPFHTDPNAAPVQLRFAYMLHFGAGLLLLLALLLAIGIFVVRPLTQLAHHARKIGRTRDFNARAPERGWDEIGDLARAFNQMVAEIAAVEQELREDIRKRLASEDALQKSREQLAIILNSARDIIVAFDRDLNIQWANEATARVLGGGPRGKTFADLSGVPDDPPDSAFIDACFRDGEPHETELAIRRPDGGTLCFLAGASPARRTPEGAPRSVICVMHDITQMKRHRAESQRAAHLAALGELSAGVAHEINNPINGIINLTQVLMDETPDDPSIQDIAVRIMAEGERIARIIQSLLYFARDNKEPYEPLAITDVIRETLALTEAQLRGDGIRLTVDIPDRLPLVNGHFQLLQQVFLNLVNNARHALNRKHPDGDAEKRIDIRTEVLRDSDSFGIRIVIEDRGPGIPDALKGKVLEPFFTTKAPGEGTGLGLSISHGIVQSHGGTLRIESREGEYTRAMVDLPALRDGESAPEPQALNGDI